MLYTSIVNTAFKYVILTSKQFNIDESHAVRHSMDAFHFANKIYDSEIYSSPFLKGQKNMTKHKTYLILILLKLQKHYKKMQKKKK